MLEHKRTFTSSMNLRDIAINYLIYISAVKLSTAFFVPQGKSKITTDCHEEVEVNTEYIQFTFLLDQDRNRVWTNCELHNNNKLYLQQGCIGAVGKCNSSMLLRNPFAFPHRDFNP